MYLRSTRRLFFGYNKTLANSRCFSDKSGKRNNGDQKIEVPPPEHPLSRTVRLLKRDGKTIKNFFTPSSSKVKGTSDEKLELITNPNEPIEEYDFEGRIKEFQTNCDILVIGGGGIGSSIAYWLKKRARKGLHVVVVEKDASYSQCSTSLSVGGLRQQFSLEENIEMSLYGADFLRDIKENFQNNDIDINFIPNGYLLLATEESAENLQKNSRLQNEMGAKNEILTAKRLKEKFPWLNTDGIACGCHGLEKEGWFDPWALLSGFKNTAQRMGAHYETGEVVGFEFRNQQDLLMEGIEPGSYDGLDKAIIRLPNGEIKTTKFAICIIAGGAQSGKISKLAKIGTGSGLLSIPLPIEPRKRFVYVFDTQDSRGPGLNCPLMVDPTNVYFRKDGLGGNYIAGRSPPADREPSVDNLDVDYEYFETDVWPALAERVPCFENLKLKSAWAGFYEMNTFDENGIIGPHPYYNNLYIAAGFSGHGIQHTPAIGRGIAELIIDGDYRTIDMTRLCFDRIIVDQPMYEVNIV